LDHRPVKGINKFHEKRALQNADGLISVSQFTADLTNQLFNLNKQFTIIPNAVDMRLFSSNSNENKNPSLLEVVATACAEFSSAKQSLEKNLNDNSILYFGTLIRKKGLLELPLIFNQVVEQLPEAQLLLVGRDASDIVSGNRSTWEMMQALFSPKALKNVTYLGGVSYADIKKHIEQATLCVFPTFAEALPVSWLEAMAMQKPIVASNIGWANEMIEDGEEGFLVNPKDHTTYANKIVTLLDDSELQKQFGRAAKQKVAQKFSMDVVAKQSLVFYESLIEKN
jgi:glycosyltransferase involved in cell wall biosynthesis